MNTLIAVARTELLQQLRKPFFWLALLLVNGLVLSETFPSVANFARLTHLTDTAYAAHRAFFLGTPVMAIAAALLSVGCVRRDRRLGMQSLLWTSSEMSPMNYVFGKLCGCAAAFMLYPVLTGLAAGIMRAMIAPADFLWMDYALAILVMGLLPMLFMVALAVTLGALLGERIAGVLLLAYLLWSSMSIQADPVTGATQIYRFMGNLGYLVFVVPGWLHRSALLQAAWGSTAFVTCAPYVCGLVFWLFVRFQRKGLQP